MSFSLDSRFRGNDTPMSNDVAARVLAQAKINLFLRVGERQPDGYHSIQTLFQRIELGDDVVVRASDSPSRSIVCRGMDVGPSEKNLAFRAAMLYAAECSWPSGFAIEIDKRIPVGGGLGGGSADAAAVLRILNHLSPTPISKYELMRLGFQLGADVPFLVSDSCLSIGEGRGEELRTLTPLPTRGVTLFKMPFSVATAEAYGWLDAEREAQPNVRPMKTPPIDAWDDVARAAQNDFEQVVGDRHQPLDVLLALARSAEYELAEMTGSGSTVFAISSDSEPIRAPDYVAEGIEQLMTRTAITVAPIVDL